MLKKLYHRNPKICQQKNLLFLPLLIIVFVYQLNGTKIQFLFGIHRKLRKSKNCNLYPNTLLNNNMGGLLEVRFEGSGSKNTLCLKLVRIMQETSKFVRKYTRICSFRNIHFSTKTLLILPMSAIFLQKNRHVLAIIVPLLKAIL